MNLTHLAQRVTYRNYRRLKRFLLCHPQFPLARTFFSAVAQADGLMSERKQGPLAETEARMWKAFYFSRFPDGGPFRLETDVPVAFDSDDHKWPRGTLNDFSVNRRFNLKVYDHFRQKRDLALLDLGCSGGGLVESFLRDGYTAVGVEGSDVSRKLRSGAWDTIPYHLFTADVTRPFHVRGRDGSAALFDVVTAWEVLEHIPAECVPALVDNIARHLAPGGLFVGSVDVWPDANLLTGAVYHVNLNPRSWWLEQFARAGLVEATTHPFEVEDYVRGHGRGLRDWDPRDGMGFHLVMRRA